MSKLADYLKKQKIDPRRVLAASHKVEALTPEDRRIKLARRQLKSADEKTKERLGELAAKKPRSGRALSRPTLNRALDGGELSGAARNRVLRAVNAVLSQKKKGESTLDDLF